MCQRNAVTRLVYHIGLGALTREGHHDLAHRSDSSSLRHQR